MILKGNQRGGAKDLALHLMKQENEHVEVHDIRGFASQNLMGALNEAYAISRGTRCKQFLYSLSLNPPPGEYVKIADFEAAIARIEEQLGLQGQPRAIVFHEKEGRRHAHAVWSRIDVQKMKAVQMSFDHEKLKLLSRELFLEHGWKMPRGLVNSDERNPKNFTYAEWQQAKRIGKNSPAIKTDIQDAWAISDSKAAFHHALAERGYVIARGDRRGFVAVDVHGEVYSIPRMTNVKTKQVRERLGDQQSLPSVDEAKAQIANDMVPVIKRFKEGLKTQVHQGKVALLRERDKLVTQQRAARQVFNEHLAQHQKNEALERQARFRPGLKGLWDRLRGEHVRIQQQNERESEIAAGRDRTEKEAFIAAQLAQRSMIQQRANALMQSYRDERQSIDHDLSRYNEIRQGLPERQRSFSREPVR